MSYTTFTDEEVFSDPAITSVMNVLFTDLIDEFTDIEIEDKFALSGSVAKIIQEEMSADTVLKVLPMRTSDSTMFEYFIANALRWFGVPAMVYPDRCTIAWHRAYVELWLSPGALTIEIVDGLICEKHDTIPINIL